MCKQGMSVLVDAQLLSGTMMKSCVNSNMFA